VPAAAQSELAQVLPDARRADGTLTARDPSGIPIRLVVGPS
jgi:hypothetical protein